MNKIQYLIMALFLFCATAVKAQSFVTVKDGKLYRDGKPYTFIGTNYWYGAILGSKGKGGIKTQQAVSFIKVGNSSLMFSSTECQAKSEKFLK